MELETKTPLEANNLKNENKIMPMRPPLPSFSSQDSEEKGSENNLPEKTDSENVPKRPPLPNINNLKNKAHSTLNSSFLGFKQKLSKKLEETATSFQHSHPESSFGARLDHISKQFAASVQADSIAKTGADTSPLQSPNRTKNVTFDFNKTDPESKIVPEMVKDLESTPSKKDTNANKYSFTAMYNKSQDAIVSSAIVRNEPSEDNNLATVVLANSEKPPSTIITRKEIPLGSAPPPTSKFLNQPAGQSNNITSATLKDVNFIETTHKSANEDPVLPLGPLKTSSEAAIKQPFVHKKEPSLDFAVEAREDVDIFNFPPLFKHNHQITNSTSIGQPGLAPPPCQCLFWHGLKLPPFLSRFCGVLFAPLDRSNQAHLTYSQNLKETAKNYLIYALCLALVILTTLLFFLQKFPTFVNVETLFGLGSHFFSLATLKFYILSCSFFSGIIVTIAAIYAYDRTFGACETQLQYARKILKLNSQGRQSPTNKQYTIEPNYTQIIEKSQSIPQEVPPPRPVDLPTTVDLPRSARLSEDTGFFDSSRPIGQISPIISTMVKDDSEISYKSYQDAIGAKGTESIIPRHKFGRQQTFRVDEAHQIWMNELPFKYEFETYRVQQTRTVLLKLEGSILKMSMPKQKLPKRHMWNEKEQPANAMTYINHRIYDISDAALYLLPGDMPKKVYWNKKYPICLRLKPHPINVYTYEANLPSVNKFKKFVGVSAQQLPKVTENNVETVQNEKNESKTDTLNTKNNNLFNAINNINSKTDSGERIMEIYLFARANREKEEWFWRLLRSSYVYGRSKLLNAKRNEMAAKQASNITDMLDLKSTSAHWVKPSPKVNKPSMEAPTESHTNLDPQSNKEHPEKTGNHSKFRLHISKSPMSRTKKPEGEGERTRKKRASRSSSPLSRDGSSEAQTDDKDGSSSSRFSSSEPPQTTTLSVSPKLFSHSYGNRRDSLNTLGTYDGIYFDPTLYIDTQQLRLGLSPLIFDNLLQASQSTDTTLVDHFDKSKLPLSDLNKIPTTTNRSIGIVSKTKVLASKIHTTTSAKTLPSTVNNIINGPTKDTLVTSNSLSSLKSDLKDVKNQPKPSLTAEILKKTIDKGLKRDASPDKDSSKFTDTHTTSKDERALVMGPTTKIHPELCWLNALMERVTWDVFNRHFLDPKIEAKIKRKLTKVKLPYFIEPLNLVNFSTGPILPTIHMATRPWTDDKGIWWEFLVSYSSDTIPQSHSSHSVLNLNSQNLNNASTKHKIHLSTANAASTAKDSSTDAKNENPLGAYITLSTKINLMKLKEGDKMAATSSDVDPSELLLAKNILEDNPDMQNILKMATNSKLYKRRKTWTTKGSESEDTPESSTEEDESPSSVSSKSKSSSHHHSHKSHHHGSKGTLAEDSKSTSTTISTSTLTSNSTKMIDFSSQNISGTDNTLGMSMDDNKLTEFEQKVANAAENRGKKILKMVDKIANSKYFQQATDMKYIKKGMVAVSNTPIVLTVELCKLEGIVKFNLPNPPSDRLWYGFKPKPEMKILAKPKLGAKHVNISHLVDWIQSQLFYEFEKLLVIPNMDDIVIPVMKSGQIDEKPFNL